MHIGPTSIITGSVDGHVRTYDLRKGELRTDYIGRASFPLLQYSSFILIAFPTDPITSLLPTADSQTLLVTTLDSHIRLLDLSTGQVLNTFKGHTGKEYRVRACFGAAEASVVCGDEDGRVWGWDLVDVSFTLVSLTSTFFLCIDLLSC
jgi:mitogen-activated protein kinase organizer 1